MIRTVRALRTPGRPGRPAIAPEPRPAGWAEVKAMLDAIITKLNQDERRDEAFVRFQTVGVAALPMTMEQVAVVLSLTPGGVRTLCHRGQLKRRSAALAGFHPDDVRQYLAQRQ